MPSFSAAAIRSFISWLWPWISERPKREKCTVVKTSMDVCIHIHIYIYIHMYM